MRIDMSLGVQGAIGSRDAARSRVGGGARRGALVRHVALGEAWRGPAGQEPPPHQVEIG